MTDAAGAPVEREEGEVTWDADAAEKGGYETFMIKEIHEQPQALADTLAGRLRDDGKVDLSEVDLSDDLLRRLRRVLIIGCGTSYHAGLIASYAMESFTGLPVQVDLASEFRYRNPVLDDEVLVIGISQSGETLDTLAAMRLAREAGAPVLALTNIMGSQATREADAVLFTRAGLEVGVAATKTHVAQIAALLLLTLHLARRARHALRRRAPAGRARALRGAGPGRGLPAGQPPGRRDRAALLRRVVLLVPRPQHRLRRVPRGRPQAQGDRLHPDRVVRRRRDEAGPIALLDNGSPVVMVANDRPVYAKVVSNIEEVRARGAEVIAVASEGNDAIEEIAAAVLRIRAAARWWPPWWRSCHSSCWPTTSPACAA